MIPPCPESTSAVAKQRKSWFSTLVVSFVAPIASWIIHEMTYYAGMAVKPELTTLLRAVSFWGPICAGIAVACIPGPGSLSKRVLVKSAFFLICVSPLFFSQFRRDLGWERFRARVQQDVRPHDLSQWLAGYLTTNTSPEWAMSTLAPAQMGVFCGGTMQLTSAWVEKGDRSVMIGWGSDLQTWAIVYGRATEDCIKWQEGLYFRQLSK